VARARPGEANRSRPADDASTTMHGARASID